jgi:hypothetical protein
LQIYLPLEKGKESNQIKSKTYKSEPCGFSEIVFMGFAKMIGCADFLQL